MTTPTTSSRHFTFLNAYLRSRGGRAGQSRAFPHAAQQQGDRCAADQAPHEPDGSSPSTRPGGRATAAATRTPTSATRFPPAVPGLLKGSSRRSPDPMHDLKPANHLQAIANTAGFHFATIEQGGTQPLPVAGSAGQRSPRCCASCSASDPPKRCTFRPGWTRPVTRRR